MRSPQTAHRSIASRLSVPGTAADVTAQAPTCHPQATAVALRVSRSATRGVSRLEDDPGGDAAGLDVGDRLVDVVERAPLADDARPARGMEVEDLAQVGARPDDRPDDGAAVEHGLEAR